ncbi:MAG: alpha/beta fold hydrolase, partial [Actinomycetota bacterium]
MANDVRFNVVRIGGGDQTVVFLHGLVMDNLSSFYYTLANPIAKRADVVLYDLRGHGRSERPATGYTVEDSVADLVALLDELGVDRPAHLIGNSYGGVVGLATAIAHPERVAGLGLIEAHFAVEGWGHHMAGSLALAAFGLDDDDLQLWLEQQGGRKLNRMARNAEALIYD